MQGGLLVPTAPAVIINSALEVKRLPEFRRAYASLYPVRDTRTGVCGDSEATEGKLGKEDR
jgi:hypothetical protein